jgi:kanamycin kinase
LLDWATLILGQKVNERRVRSGNESQVFELATDTEKWFLKIDHRGLRQEAERLTWLNGRLAAPSVVGHADSPTGEEGLLLTALPGADLAHLSESWEPELVISRLSYALHLVHAFDARDWPFGGAGHPGQVLTHGDACLPNFLFKEDGTLSGFIDVGAMRLGDPVVDLSAAVWSLDFNLGPGHGVSFLREYGISHADDAMAEELRIMYEQDVLGGELPRWR